MSKQQSIRMTVDLELADELAAFLTKADSPRLLALSTRVKSLSERAQHGHRMQRTAEGHWLTPNGRWRMKQQDKQWFILAPIPYCFNDCGSLKDTMYRIHFQLWVENNMREVRFKTLREATEATLTLDTLADGVMDTV